MKEEWTEISKDDLTELPTDQHSKYHEAKKVFKCGQCGKTFNRNDRNEKEEKTEAVAIGMTLDARNDPKYVEKKETEFDVFVAGNISHEITI